VREHSFAAGTGELKENGKIKRCVKIHKIMNFSNEQKTTWTETPKKTTVIAEGRSEKSIGKSHQQKNGKDKHLISRESE